MKQGEKINNMDIKNNSRMLGFVLVIIFAGLVIVGKINRNKKLQGIREHKGTITGKTIGCTKNVKSSMCTMHYAFSYKDVQYYGTEQINSEQSGKICNGYFFLVEFDTINPVNSKMILDSLRGDLSNQ